MSDSKSLKKKSSRGVQRVAPFSSDEKGIKPEVIVSIIFLIGIFALLVSLAFGLSPLEFLQKN